MRKPRSGTGVLHSSSLKPEFWCGSKLPVPLERSERCGPERCSGTFRTVAPAAARYVLSKNNFISNETPHQARHCIREKGKRPNHQTASPGSPFLCKVASEGTDTESKRSRQSKKCTPTRQLLAELPSFSLHPRHDSTWAMSFGQDGTNWPGHVPAAPARADGRKAWRAEVPAGEDEKEEGREAVAAVRDQLRLQSDSPVWGDWGTSWFMRSTSTSSRRGCWRFRTTQLP